MNESEEQDLVVRQKQNRAARLSHRSVVRGASFVALFIGCHSPNAERARVAQEETAPSTLWHVREEKPAAVLTRVESELKQPGVPAWAGRYVKGSGTNSDRLCLAPTAGWVWIKGDERPCCSSGSHSQCAPDCPGAREALEGEVFETKNGILRLALKMGENEVVLFGEYIPVVWGSRRYLVRSDERAPFEAAVAKGEEPRRTAEGAFYMGQGDERQAPTGEPRFGDKAAGN